jgi:hypothetical protein
MVWFNCYQILSPKRRFWNCTLEFSRVICGLLYHWLWLPDPFFFFTVLLRMILVASCRVWMYYLFDLLNEEWKPYWFLRGKTSKTIVNSSIPPFLLSFGEELKKKRKIGFQFLIFFAIESANLLCLMINPGNIPQLSRGKFTSHYRILQIVL